MSKKEKAAKKAPKQARLPGTEDAPIQALESAAERYAEIRDERIALSKEEGELKAGLLILMKKNGKTAYKHNGVEIWIELEEETVKVKIRKEEKDEVDE